ncbi:hypothetical protein [Candidatus Epulonipiscium viviparus]|uniref:hypothetical protein n=1 Tax=Candidatus Epulonipiscium viviparus TaxID=420336 RepID=UPI00016C01F9|nr:hypothetical protein [Candidatus Epulopiscium viviparus]
MISINPRLENYIFTTLGAIYDTNYDETKANLENDAYQNRKYLGTYFPRTFVEAYRIYYNLFAQQIVWQTFDQKDEIKIIAIGSGTGGDIFGLLNVLNHYFTNKTFTIYSIDGNANALQLQTHLIEHIQSFIPLDSQHNKLVSNLYKITFNNPKVIAQSLKNLHLGSTVDIMHTFKFCNEIYNFLDGTDIFSQIISLAETHLTQNGLLVLEDVTTKNYDCQYNAVTLNNQINNYMKAKKDTMLRYILPKPCARWNEDCQSTSCFSSVQYSVQHRGNPNDISAVTYKVVAKPPLGDSLIQTFANEPGVYKMRDIADGHYCLGGQHYQNVDDASNSNINLVRTDPFIL